MQYQYPCRIAPDLTIPRYVKEKMNSDGLLYFSVQFETSKTVQSTFTFIIKPNQLPSELLELALNKKFSTIEADKSNLAREKPNDYLLKTPGREEYLIEEVPLIQYMSVQEHISQEEMQAMPLVAVYRSSVNGTRISRAFNHFLLVFLFFLGHRVVFFFCQFSREMHLRILYFVDTVFI